MKESVKNVIAAGLAFMMMFMGLLASREARSSDYGCKVLLCLANPGGPEQYAQCVPPIEQLKNDLLNGNPFPTCEEAGGGSFTSMVNSHYDPCPTGLTSLPNKSKGVIDGDLTPPPPPWRPQVRTYRTVYVGGEDGAVCYGKFLKTVEIRTCSRGDKCMEKVGVYDKIITQQWYPSGTGINVYINNSLYRRVHLQ
ncbi:MAG: hypothetical protein ACYCZR_01650 [Burkholderiales bacterium]